MAADPRAHHETMPIAYEDDVFTTRRAVRALAEKNGFDPFAVAALTTAVSELARNIWVHARTGTVTVDLLHRDGRPGIQVEFKDEGPGIEDVERALEGGHSTIRSLGMGLAGSRRLVDEFEIASVVGRGTVIRIVKWKRAS